jgi:gliding motility-associated-like protein
MMLKSGPSTRISVFLDTFEIGAAAVEDMKTFRILFITTCLCIGFTTVRSQAGLCPPNIDFEKGDFTNWQCRTGIVGVENGVNNIEWSGAIQIPGRHDLIPGNSAVVDQFGLFPISCPNGSGYSVKLGNSKVNFEAEGLSYTYAIPATITRFSLLINYAVVLQDPDHQPEEQPRFRARIVNVTDGETDIACVNFDFTASGAMPGFQTSALAGNVRYKDWTPISVDLSAYIGKTIRLEFITSDCTRGAHFGYAYVDVNSSCSGAISGNVLCQGDGTLTLQAPYGFQSYSWFSDNTFSTLLGTGQTLFLNPAPAAGSTFPLIITPYPGFGCVDTLVAEITTGVSPESDAGPDKLACSKQETLIGAPPLAGMSYSWTPSALLDDENTSAPSVLPQLPGITDFIVRTTDQLTGCFSFDTVTVQPMIIDTSTSITGSIWYCPGESFGTTLTVNNPGASIQWYMNESPINTATGINFTPTPAETTDFWALLTLNGCYDSTRRHTITIAKKPNAQFKIDSYDHCLNGPSTFHNISSIPDNTSMQYLWKFSDGFQSNDSTLVRTFSTTGQLSAMLIATSVNGCKDTVQKIIRVLNACGAYVPSAFTPNNDGLNDVLKPFLAGHKAFKKFTVYNRYGNVVYSTTKLGEGWDGTYKGMKLQSGVFVWVIEYTSAEDRSVVEKGVITLIR